MIHTEQGSTEELELKKSCEVNKALDGRLQKLEIELEEVEKAKKVLDEEKDACAAEKKALKEELKGIKSALVPNKEESEDVKGMTTRAELIARIQQADNDTLVAIEDSFKNIVAQIHLVNPGVNIVLMRTNFLHSLVNGRIFVPDFLKVAGGNMAYSFQSSRGLEQPQPDTEVHPQLEKQPYPNSGLEFLCPVQPTCHFYCNFVSRAFPIFM